MDNMLSIISVLHCFRRASGLCVNFDKSNLFGIGVCNNEIALMAAIIGCKPGMFPATFLGIPIGLNMKRISSWNVLLERVKKKMANWKMKTLSIGGRLTIVNSILGNLGSYWCSLFTMPMAVARQIEAKRRNFFWGIKDNSKGIKWISWEKICKKKKFGGLGVIPIIDSNLTLLAKWPYRFKTEIEALWVQIIKSIHGDDGGFTTSSRDKMHNCGWKSILESLSYFDKFSLNPIDCMQVEIGDGNGTKFWLDKWTETGALKDSFPRCFALETNKECKVWERRHVAVDLWPRRRPIRDGRERQEEFDLRNLIQSQRILEDKPDRWIFNGAPKGVFYSAWIRERIEQCRSVGNIYKNEWLNWIPIKDNILIWRTIKGRIAVRHTLAEMGIDVPSVVCEICGDQEEDISHIFFKCDMAVWLWLRLGLWVKSSIPIFDSILDCFAWIDKQFKVSSKIKTVKAIVAALIKTIWIHRNDIIFNNNRVEKEICLRRMQEISYFWMYNRSSKNFPDLASWLANPFCNS